MSIPITDTLRKLRDGQFVEQATEELHELILACTSTGKKGRLTIELNLSPGKNNRGVMNIEAEVKSKSPKFEVPTDTMFVNDAGELVSNNPKQTALDLKQVAGVTIMTKEALKPGVDFDPATGEDLRPVAKPTDTPVRPVATG